MSHEQLEFMELIDRPELRDTAVVLTCLYLFGVALSMYPPVVMRVGGTQIMRLDWLFSIPLVLYAAYRWDRSVPRPMWFGMLFFSALVLSIFTNTIYSYFDFVTYTLQIVYNLAVIGAVMSFRFDSERLVIIYRVWVGILLLMSLYALYQSFALNYGLPIDNVYFGAAPDSFPPVVHGYARPASFFREPRWFSVFLMTALAISIASIGTRSWFLFENRRVEYAVLSILLAATILAASFGGYLSLGALLVLTIALPPTRAFGLRLTAAVAGFFVVVVPVTAQIGWSYAEMVLTRVNNNFVPMIMFVVNPLADLLPSAGTAGGGSGASGDPTTATPSPTSTPVDTTTPTATPKPASSPDTDGGESFAQQQSSMKIRLVAILGGLFAWKSNLLVGVGPGQFAEWAAANGVAGMLPLETDSVDAIHSYWVEVLASSGLIGFTFLGAIWASVIKEMSAVWNSADDLGHALVVAGALLIGIQAIDAVWDVTITFPIRWIFLGLAFSHANYLRK